MILILILAYRLTAVGIYDIFKIVLDKLVNFVDNIKVRLE